VSYVITITQVETVKATVRGQWTVVNERPYTNSEMNDAYTTKEGDPPLKREYGYAPDREGEKEVFTKLFEQTLDQIDLPAIIIAANNIKGGVA